MQGQSILIQHFPRSHRWWRRSHPTFLAVDRRRFLGAMGILYKILRFLSILKNVNCLI